MPTQVEPTTHSTCAITRSPRPSSLRRPACSIDAVSGMADNNATWRRESPKSHTKITPPPLLLDSSCPTVCPKHGNGKRIPSAIVWRGVVKRFRRLYVWSWPTWLLLFFATSASGQTAIWTAEGGPLPHAVECAPPFKSFLENQP